MAKKQVKDPDGKTHLIEAVDAKEYVKYAGWTHVGSHRKGRVKTLRDSEPDPTIGIGDPNANTGGNKKMDIAALGDDWETSLHHTQKKKLAAQLTGKAVTDKGAAENIIREALAVQG